LFTRSTEETEMLQTPAAIRRLAAVALCGVALLMAGCETPTAPVAPEGSLNIRDLELSHQRLAGAEGFTVSVVVAGPVGRYVKAYGIKTPYETIVRPLKQPLNMAIPNGWMSLRQVHFNRVPVVGDYPFEVWLVNESGQVSNRLSAKVYVQ
jgi:hypothetical protein